ncbi:hypothetical protein Tco_1154593 [Tanacetum coccineum]
MSSDNRPSLKQGGSSQHPQKTDNDKEKVSQDETKGVKTRTSTTDKGKEKARKDEIDGVEARTKTIDSEFNRDDDSAYDSDKSVHYLSTRYDMSKASHSGHEPSPSTSPPHL